MDNSMKTNCLRCSWEWVPRVENPKKCPRCKSYLWENKKELEKCEKCGKHFMLIHVHHKNRNKNNNKKSNLMDLCARCHGRI